MRNNVDSVSDNMDEKIQNFIRQKKDENMALKKLLSKLESKLKSKGIDSITTSKI